MTNENTQPIRETNETDEQRVGTTTEESPDLRAPGQSGSGQLSTADVANAMQNRQASKDGPNEREAEHLLPEDRLASYRERWQSIQITFVDEPKSSVEQADSLVAEVIQTLAQRFAEERDSLEHQWSDGGEASTEDMRQALQHYRTFFERLLAA